MMINFTLIKSKLKASGIHFCISSVVFLILAFLIIFRWYPPPYFTADGGWQGIRIIAIIDLILGPFITLIIYNPSKLKKEIHFDLGLIALIQAIALVWGIYTVHSERPVAVVHWDGEFYTLPAKHFEALSIPLNELEQFSKTRPALIHADRPNDFLKLKEILAITTEQKLAPYEQFHLYRPFKENQDKIFSYKIDIDEIITTNAKMKTELDNFLFKSKKKKEDYVYMPLIARYHNVVLIFSNDGDVAGTINAPYKEKS